MGFWNDDVVDNGYDRLFDLDRDGTLNRFERSMQLDFMTSDESRYEKSRWDDNDDEW